MTYYDHATAMAYKLDRWGEERVLRNFELEALACEQAASANFGKKQSIFKRCMSVFRSHNLSEANDTPKPLIR